jgi:hypothetical protein
MASQKSMIIAELRALLRLTETEIQVAETRRAQARTEAVERELAENADNGRLRATAIARVLREEGGVPDIVNATAGRVAALAKSNLEQGQPFTEALLGDLALEHQLQDRATLLKALGTAAGRTSVVELADRLIDAHSATVEWLTGGPGGGRARWPGRPQADPLSRPSSGPACRWPPSPPARSAVASMRLLGKASRTLDTFGATSQEVAEKLDDVQARATSAVKQELAPDEDELPVTGTTSSPSRAPSLWSRPCPSPRTSGPSSPTRSRTATGPRWCRRPRCVSRDRQGRRRRLSAHTAREAAPVRVSAIAHAPSARRADRAPRRCPGLPLASPA